MKEELGTMVQDAFAGMVRSGKMEQMVAARVEQCVQEALKECTGYNSPFAKVLKDAVTAALPFDAAQMDLGSYGASVVRVVKAKLDGCLAVWVDKSIAESMDDLLKMAPQTMKLSELADQFLKQAKEADVDVRWMEMSKRNYGDDERYYHIDIKVKRGSRDEEYSMGVGADGKVYSLRVPYEGDVTKQMFAGKRYGVEALLWSLYVGKTTLVVDEFEERMDVEEWD